MRLYRTVNLILLGVMVYALIFPVISPVLHRIAPAVFRCHYRAVTKNPCLFCGLTRDMSTFLQGDTEEEWQNTSFPLMLRVFEAEFLLRILFTTGSFLIRRKWLIPTDLGIHGLSACFAVVSVLAA